MEEPPKMKQSLQTDPTAPFLHQGASLCAGQTRSFPELAVLATRQPQRCFPRLLLGKKGSPPGARDTVCMPTSLPQNANTALPSEPREHQGR